MTSVPQPMLTPFDPARCASASLEGVVDVSVLCSMGEALLSKYTLFENKMTESTYQCGRHW